MARGKKTRTRPAKAEAPVESDEDIQILKRSGKASFNRDETFENSEDEFMEQRDQIMLDGSKWGRQKDSDVMSASDEEILPLDGLSDEDSEDEEVSDGQDDDRSLDEEEQEDEEEDLDKEGWGSSRKVYYGADDVSDEEDVAQEEQEAERLQKKHLARLRPEDFLDTWTDVPATGSEETNGRIVTEELPAQDLSKLSKADVLKLLKARHPEVPRLANLYQRLYPQLSSLSLLAQRPFHPQHSIIKLKLALLSILLSSIAVFFAVRADQKERKSTEKKLVTKISETETLWKQFSSIVIDENAVDVKEVTAKEHELDNLITLPKPTPKPKTSTLKRKRAPKTLADDSDSDTELASTLSLLKKSRTKAKRGNLEEENLSDFADPITLHPLDAQEKSQNKKTLRFYAAQIENKGVKRREKYSGDTDVFRERRNDRNERQIEEARKRGLTVSAPIEEGSSDEEVVIPAVSDDYYDTIAARTAHKKIHGKEEYESSKAAARAYLLGQTEEVDEGGKRLITRQIEKNKGLMPKRNKDVRNPRVKKRKKYEKKKIALKGRQQVYKVGDRRRGAYGGEETGISKNIVKGVKLG